MTPQGLNLGRS